jgi:hypothetical protein
MAPWLSRATAPGKIANVVRVEAIKRNAQLDPRPPD